MSIQQVNKMLKLILWFLLTLPCIGGHNLGACCDEDIMIHYNNVNNVHH